MKVKILTAAFACAALSGCAATPTWPGQPAAVQEAQKKLQEKVNRRTATYKASHPCPVPGRSPTECPGYDFGMTIPVECGGVDDASNYEWRTPEKSGDVKRMAAQCIMQAQAMQQQAVAAGSIQQQMQNALLYNDMTRIMGNGIYQMMK